MHTAITQNVIKNWIAGVDGPEWQEIALELQPEFRQMFIDQTEIEKANAIYLFRNGTPLLGMNGKILGQYCEFMANKRMVNVGLEPAFPTEKDPLPWIQRNWLGDKQVAPQETEKTDYRTGNINKNAETASLVFTGLRR